MNLPITTLALRILSGLIDVIFYIAVFSVLSFIFTGEIDNLPDSVAWIPVCAYILCFHAYLNKTPGMKLVGFKFVDVVNNQKPAYWKMIVRWIIASMLRFTLVGSIIGLATFDKDTGFFWDKWFGVKVIKDGFGLFKKNK